MTRMRDGNKDRIGYKKTKVGWIPQGWECLPSGNLFDIQLGKMLNKKARIGRNPQPYLANYNVRWGTFDLSDVQEMHFSKKEIEKFKLQCGDLLVCEGGEVGRCAVWQEQINPCFYQKALHRIRSLDGNIDIYFIMHFLHHAVLSPMMVNYVGHSSIAHFTREQFLKFPIALPPIPEQKRIAKILSTWDTAIIQSRNLISQKKKHKKALMQKLFNGEKRFRKYGSHKTRCEKYTDSWNIVELRDLFKPVKRKNLENCKRVLTASGRLGLIAQNDYFNSSVAGQSLHNYFLLKKGEFAYNRSSMKNFTYGAVRRLDKYDKGVLSTLYICFSLYDKCNISDFYKHFFENNTIAHELSSIVQVGARAHGLLNISQDDFFKIKIPKPSLKEQSRIAEILNEADYEIAALGKNLLLLEKQKRGLMQKLLTGEVRVNP